jgi:hypothetical protein
LQAGPVEFADFADDASAPSIPVPFVQTKEAANDLGTLSIFGSCFFLFEGDYSKQVGYGSIRIGF